MYKLITAVVALTVLSACDSEGIDRQDLETPTAASPQVATPQNDGTNISTEGNSTTVSNGDNVDNTDSAATEDASGNGNGTDTSTNTDDSATTDVAVDNSVNTFGGSGSSDGGENDVNTFGGSGSSDGGQNTVTDTSPSDQPLDDQPTATDPVNASPVDASPVDASLDTAPPASGTTFVSTVSPIRTEAGPRCLGPKKDEFGNVLYNERGNCPLVDFHGDLKFGDFALATNAWNFCASTFTDWNQCISVQESNGKVMPRWDYDWGEEHQVNGQVWLVKSYPEIIYGVKSPTEHSGNTLAETQENTGLPAKVTELPFYKIDYAFSSQEYTTRGKDVNGQRVNGERNIAVEAFFHELAGDCDVNSLVRNGNTSNQRFEIMLWLDAGPERLPAAPNDFVTTQTLDGIAYDIYTKPSDPEYIAFVAQNPTTSGSINWTTFIEWTRNNSYRLNEQFGRGFNTVKLQDDWCMANILLGTEIWWGAGFFQADEWTISRTVR